MIKKKKLTPHVVYGKNGTVVILRVPAGTPEKERQDAILDAKRMAANESTTYTSNYRGKRYAKKSQTSLFGY